jgi:hypothetical protein
MQSLSYDGAAVTWLRGGSSPEVWRTSFEQSLDDASWSYLGAGTRIPGGWRLSDVALAAGTKIRARGWVTSGQYNGSTWFVEQTATATPPWPIRLSVLRDAADVVLRWSGGLGTYQVEQTADISNSNSWQSVGAAVQTNSVTLPIGAGNLFLRVRRE